MRRPIAATAPAALAAVWLLSLFAPLLSPGRALASRDIPLFHLPLRTAFRWLVEFGVPGWNPWLHGGQPVLSNPNYAAFYPPSWLVFLVPPSWALSLLALLHGALAFAGAFRLARRLGVSPGVAALAGVGFSGSGALLSLLSAFNFFCGMAWLPWVILFGDEVLGGPGRGGALKLRPVVLLGMALALQLLAGEPAACVISGLALLGLAVATAGRRPAAWGRLAAGLGLAVLLSAVQLLPTLGRLADSPRAGGLPAAQATLWSSPPARLVELAFPRFFGDPARDQEGFYFGWNLHDRDYPYVVSIYPGLLLAVLGLAALLKWPVPRRTAWALAALAGAFLALGRNNPLFEAVREVVPVLSVLRFPEKFVVLLVLALLFAGVLGWHWLLAEREAGRRQSADFPVALAGVLLATAATLAALVHAAPRVGAWFIRAHGAPGLSPERQAAGLAFLRAESWMAVATAAAVLALLALCRWGRTPRRLLEGLAVLLLGLDLWHYGHGLVKTLPASVYAEPPRLAAPLLPAQSRMYVEPLPEGEPDLFARVGDPGEALARANIARLEPYSGLLWLIPYALHEDYDLMLTGWARRSLAVLHAEREQPEVARRYLGAWNVGTILERKPAAEWTAELAQDPGVPPSRAVPNPHLLRRYRFVPRAVFHATWEDAVRAARGNGWTVAGEEHCVRPGSSPGALGFTVPPRPLSINDQGGLLRLHYRAEEGAFFVAAVTFDAGWRATLDGGTPLEVWPTAAGQMGIALPPGEHRLELEYTDPLVPVGAAVTGAALLACVLALVVARRRELKSSPLRETDPATRSQSPAW
ncbi:MAG TPA: hypothetical protein VLQ45_11470 [Thermoanaerobaculia bacterium]|nr:hypothetical protein [Thermoanaerobaculia bacterium]